MTRARIAFVGLALLLTPLGIARPSAQSAAPGVQGSVFNQPAPGQSRRFAGAPTDVDFQGADLRWVLRLLGHDIGKINVVIDPSVSSNAKVDLTLTQVAWDEIFDIVCRTNQLKWEVGGNVVRVLSADVAQKELENTQRDTDARAEASAKAGIKMESFPLNYAKGPDVEKMLNATGVLGKYAKAQFNERANLVLITGLPSDIETTRTLIRQLDQPEPQVEIEARIVETDRDSARELGVQWGMNARASADLGNTTNASFPNNGSINGRATDSSGKPAVQGPSGVGSLVNMPVPGATSGIGLNLGSLIGNMNLDVALSALEKSGKGHILSSPKVTTQNNVKAEVTQGFTIPYQAVSNNTVTVSFRDAALKLTVTPHITGANTVIMEVVLENGFPDFSRAVNGNPSISTQKAETRVLVADSVTTVIGGIVVNKDTNNKDSVPGVSKVPLIGALFRHNANSSSSQEIVIFITPRIIR
jgi:type IV pilus assembly protein PilQ